MENLITQAEFVKLVNGNQSTISKYVKQNKLPHRGKNLIMPDAEKAYYLIKAGKQLMELPAPIKKVEQNGEYITLKNYPDNDVNILEVPTDKIGVLKYKSLNLIFSNNKNQNRAVTIDGDMRFVIINKRGDYITTEIALPIITPDSEDVDQDDLSYIYCEIVPDGKITEVSTQIKASHLGSDNHYLITESELIEFLRSKKA